MALIIQKRNGDQVSFNFSKIISRVKRAAKGLTVNADEIVIRTLTSIPTDGVIKTIELDKLVSEIAASYTGNHYDYSKLAAIVAISSFHKSTNDSFYETMLDLNRQGIIQQGLIDIIEKYGPENIQKEIKNERDLMFDYFGFKSLIDTYLTKNSKGVSVERPQYMYMRVALWVTNTLEEAIEYYNFLSQQLISCATPIMINSGTMSPQLSSCVLVKNAGDSREKLLETFNDICAYSADAAGIGLCMSNIRSKESTISKTGGKAAGLLKYLKVVNEGLRFFNQQGRRPGAAAIYIEPWHKDVFDFLEIKKNSGAEELRARDIFTALWIPDNFMRAAKADEDYYLFCPNDILKAGLKPFETIYGEEFEAEYQKAVELGIGKKIRAMDMWKKIIESQIETGVPYMAAKDHINRKTNHQNLGTISSSNLCIEIMEYTEAELITAICTLSSQVLKNYIKDGVFDFVLLEQTTRKIVRALNKVIDINHYSTEKGRRGGLSQRAIGIGVQGLADTFLKLDLVFTSPEARKLNKDIFETLYYAAMSESMELCKNGVHEKYEFFEGSPYSKGIFQFNMWGLNSEDLSGRYDWDKLAEDIKKHGVCNSLVTAQMPVASSARVTSSYEMTEPINSNLFNRRVLGGEFIIANPYLIEDFEKIGIWCEDLKNEIIMNDGSIQNINFMTYLDSEAKNYNKKVKRIEFLLEKYRTIWEIKQKDLIDMAVDRAPFIDQSQSMNIYMADTPGSKTPLASKISSSHFYAWEKKLKTLSYYIRTKAISTGDKSLAIDMSKAQKPAAPIEEPLPDKPADSQFECFGCSS